MLGETIEYEELKQIPYTPRPNAGRHYHGMPHYRFVTRLRHLYMARGPRVIPVGFATNGTGTACAAALVARGGALPPLPAPLAYLVGATHDNASRRPLRLYYGAVAPDGTGVVCDYVPAPHHFEIGPVPHNVYLGLVINEHYRLSKQVASHVRRLMAGVLFTGEVKIIANAIAKTRVVPRAHLAEVVAGYKRGREVTAWALLQRFNEIARQGPGIARLDRMAACGALLIKYVRRRKKQ